jgi:hypothetical protein
VAPGPGHRKCTPYLWPGPGATPLALRLTAGLGLTADTTKLQQIFRGLPKPALRSTGLARHHYAPPAAMAAGSMRRGSVEVQRHGLAPACSPDNDLTCFAVFPDMHTGGFKRPKTQTQFGFAVSYLQHSSWLAARRTRRAQQTDYRPQPAARSALDQLTEEWERSTRLRSRHGWYF